MLAFLICRRLQGRTKQKPRALQAWLSMAIRELKIKPLFIMDLRIRVQSNPIKSYEISERNLCVATLMCVSIRDAAVKRNHGLHKRIYIKGLYNESMGK